MHRTSHPFLLGTRLTDTTNALLCEENYNHISVKNTLLEELSKRKRKHNFTFSPLEDSFISCPGTLGSFGNERLPYQKKKKSKPIYKCQTEYHFLETETDGMCFGQPQFAPGAMGLNFEVPRNYLGSAPQQVALFGSAPMTPLALSLECSGYGARDLEFLEDAYLSSEVALSPLDTYLNEMPAYVFETEPFLEKSSPDFIPLEEDDEILLEMKQREFDEIKLSLLSIVCTSLFSSPKLKNTDDPCRIQLAIQAEKVSLCDPEFVLKVALYTRRELNIRTTANFLLAFAAYNRYCRPFLKKYFTAAICLPSDWMEVADIYVTFDDVEHRPGALPSALRKVMITAFERFDEYQLAKYNKNKKSKKKNRCQTAVCEQKQSFTLKHLIKMLHISSPVEPVLCLLGKKYPKDPESFQKSGLSGTWDSDKQGKRMKLPEPETWETMISQQGNHSYVWEILIEKSKLPYMAMLRNLRNLILSGISEKYHQKVNQNIMNKNAVLKSKQFPLRFYSAYETVEEIEQMVRQKSSFDSTNGSSWKKAQKRAIHKKLQNIDVSLLKRYKTSVSKALEISVANNVDPISGSTLVICDLVKHNKEGCSGDQTELKAFQNCVLFGLICLKACENCELKLINDKNNIRHLKRNSNLLLENMMEICSSSKKVGAVDDPEDQLASALSQLMQQYMYPHILLSKKINNIILLLSSSVDCEKVKKLMNKHLQKYRQLANKDLLYVQVNIRSGQSQSSFKDLGEANNVYLSGCSDQILKFLAEKGSGKQLSHVESIDERFNLDTSCFMGMKSSLPSQTVSNMMVPHDALPKWQAVRIFISSTFKDMHGERDLLLRYVFPELKARASNLFVKVIEIDLRWGVNEEYTESKKCAEFCLREAESCDMFLGILGERYGTVCKLDVLDTQFDWIQKYPDGTSVTELEMEVGGLKDDTTKSHSLFYIRNSNFISAVPDKWVRHFESEDSSSHMKLIALKDKIRKSGVKLYDGYSCHWGGVADGKPFVAGLEEFGKRVLSDLWQAIQKSYTKDELIDEMSYEYQCHLSQVKEFNNKVGESTTKLSLMLKEIEKNDGIFVVTGRPGSGKTAFIAQLLNKIGSNFAVPFFIGATAHSTELCFMLNCISHFMSIINNTKRRPGKIEKDIVNEFHEILFDGVKSGKGNLILIFDALDHLQTSAQSLDWLPWNIPKGVKVICSASDGSVPFKVLMKRAHHGHAVNFTELCDLSLSDRKVLVKHFLGEHSKTLDESAFSNQMIQLASKADCGIPLYIQLACEYLKMFASFENLIDSIRKFPSNLSQSMEFIITEIEKNTNPCMAKKAFILLSVAKEGLDESELHMILSIAAAPDMDKNMSFEELLNHLIKLSVENLLAPISFREVLHMFRIFMLPETRDPFMKISSPLIVEIMEKNFDEKELRNAHQILAAYYMLVCDPKCDGSFAGHSAIAIRSLPYHLYNGHCYIALGNVLCSLQFIQSVFEARATHEILPYYTNLLEMKSSKSELISSSVKEIDATDIYEFYEFILRNSHILLRYPVMIMQQALNEPTDSVVYKAVHVKSLLFECVTRANEVNYRWMTINSPKVVSSVALHKQKSLAAIGCETGFVKLFEQSSGKIICSLKGHSSEITSVCFIGNEYLVTSSGDNSLCIWSIIDFILLSVLKGHSRYVSCCTPDFTNRLILSSSWDCSIRIWSINNGSEVSTVSDFECPINCVAHHPYLEIFACGLWNGKAEIWDSLSLKRKLVLHGHSGSVQCIVFSADGFNIVSSSITSEVFIWSSDQGLKLYNMKGHVLPVNSICYCLDNTFLVSASDDSSLKVWSNVQHQPFLTIDRSKFCPVHALEIIMPNLLAVAFKNCHVWLIDLTDGHIISTFENIPDQVISFSFHNTEFQEAVTPMDEPYVPVICGLTSGKIICLNADDGSHSELHDMQSPITSVVHERNAVMFGSSNGDVGIMTILTKNRKYDIVSGTHSGSVTALSIYFLEKQGFGLSASTDMMMKLWKITHNGTLNLSLLQEIQVIQRDYVTACFLLPVTDTDKLEFVTGSADNTVAFWSEDFPKVLEGLNSSIVKVYCKGNYIFGCSRDGGVATWTKSGSLIAKNDTIRECTSNLAYYLHSDILDPDDANIVLACVNNDGTIAINKPFEKMLLCSFQGHSKSVTSCSVNDDGVVISSSPDKTVNVWKAPSVFADTISYHQGKITGVHIIKSGDFAFSADISGNLILWMINSSPNMPMKYCFNKKYVGGMINSLTPVEGEKIACAVTLPGEGRPEYLLSVVTISNSTYDDEAIYFIKETETLNVSEEMCCVEYSEMFKTFIIGLKTGNIILINSKMEKSAKIARDWVLKIRICNIPSDVCAVDSMGNIRQFHLNELLEATDSKHKPKCIVSLATVKNINTTWTTALCCDETNRFYVGDADGWLSIVEEEVLFSKQVHSDSITSIHVLETYIVTCSTDKTIKVWDASKCKQVAQFCSSTPVTCMTIHPAKKKSSEQHSIMIGTTAGNVHLLKWWPQSD